MASDADLDTLRPIRRVTLAVAAVLVLLVPAALTVAGRFVWPDVWVWILLVAGFAYCAGASILVPRMVKPPAPEVDAGKVMRNVAWIRLALAGSPGFIALAMSLWLNTAIPYLAAVPVGVGLLLVTYPKAG